MIGETTGMSDFDDRPLRVAQQLECFADASLGQVLAECAAHEPPKAAGHMDWVDAQS